MNSQRKAPRFGHEPAQEAAAITAVDVAADRLLLGFLQLRVTVMLDHDNAEMPVLLLLLLLSGKALTVHDGLSLLLLVMNLKWCLSRGPCWSCVGSNLASHAAASALPA
jgi:hypothetical protein